MATIELDERWSINNHLNGGYLAAVCGQAASEQLDGATPFTISTHYLAPAVGGGPADVEVEVLRQRRLSTARVRLLREGVLLLESLVTVGTPKAHDATIAHAPVPDLPGWDECVDTGTSPFAQLPGNDVLRHVELRIDPEAAPAITGGPARDSATVRGRIVYRDGAPADAFLATAAWDLLPPTPWFMHIWNPMPTVAAQVVLHPGAFEGPLVLEARCDTIRDGVADETARVWDVHGRLVAASRQTAILAG